MNYVKAFLIVAGGITVFIGTLWLLYQWVELVSDWGVRPLPGLALTLAPVVVPYTAWVTIALGRSLGRKP